MKSESGANMIEYMLLVVLIMLVAFAAVQTFGLKVSQQFSQINSALP